MVIMENKNEVIVDVRPIGEESQLKDVIDFGTDVVVDSVVGVMDGLVGTGKDIWLSGLKLSHGETDQAAEIIKRRAHGVIEGIGETMKDGVNLAEAGVDALVNEKEFLTVENKERLTKVCKTGLYALLGGSLMDDSE